MRSSMMMMASELGLGEDVFASEMMDDAIV